MTPVAHSLPTNAGKRGRTVLDDGGVGPGGTAACLKCKRGHDLYDGPKRCNDCIAELLVPSARSRRRGVDGIIGPAPAPIAPGQVPARMVGSDNGTKSSPEVPNGWQRQSRASVIHPPAHRPKRRSPHRHSWSMSADAGTRARSARRGCGDRAGSVHARGKPDRGRCGPEPPGGDFAGSWKFHPATTSGFHQPNCGNAPGHRCCGKFRRFPPRFRARPESLPPLKRAGKLLWAQDAIGPTSSKRSVRRSVIDEGQHAPTVLERVRARHGVTQAFSAPPTPADDSGSAPCVSSGREGPAESCGANCRIWISQSDTSRPTRPRVRGLLPEIPASAGRFWCSIRTAARCSAPGARPLHS